MSTENAEEPTRYQRRAVIYFDVLGWKGLIQRSQSDDSVFDTIEEALALFTPVAGMFAMAGESFRLSQFSDHFVASAPLRFSGTFPFVVDAAKNAIVKLLATRCLMIRGAIVVGDIVHTPTRIYGPALVEAHELESQVAIYPRVLLSDAAVRLAQEEDGPDRVPRRRDTDGRWFLDILAPCGTLTPDPTNLAYQLLREYLFARRQELRDELANPLPTSRPEVRAKRQWMLDYMEAGLSG